MNIVSRLRGYYRTKRAERQLVGLSDHTLHDIGISRSDIPHIVRKGR